jgi:mono/diheme cytochrome c family protein
MEVTVRSVHGALLAVLYAACDGAQVEGDRVDAILALEGDPVAGEAQYQANCATCHASDGSGGSGPAIAGWDDPPEFVEVVVGGDGTMPAFGSLLDQDIADMLAFVEAL